MFLTWSNAEHTHTHTPTCQHTNTNLDRCHECKTKEMKKEGSRERKEQLLLVYPHSCAVYSDAVSISERAHADGHIAVCIWFKVGTPCAVTTRTSVRQDGHDVGHVCITNCTIYWLTPLSFSPPLSSFSFSSHLLLPPSSPTFSPSHLIAAGVHRRTESCRRWAPHAPAARRRAEVA